MDTVQHRNNEDEFFIFFSFSLSLSLLGMKRTEGEKSPWAKATKHATTAQCRLASVRVCLCPCLCVYTFKAAFERGGLQLCLMHIK